LRTRRRFGWLTAALLTAGLATGSTTAGAATTLVHAQGNLSDFQVGTYNATDGASAELWGVASGGSTAFRVVFTGLDPAAAGARFGVHIHVGPCVAGNGPLAGPHYNTGGPASTSTEVWLDFTVRAGGYGYATTTVPFVIAPGAAQSMVIHALPTAPGGAAGARQACLPVSFGGNET
jgi:Cu/Zn superoxide dismutase